MEINVNIKVVLAGTEHKKIFATIYIGESEICTLRGTHVDYIDDCMFVNMNGTHQTIENINEIDVQDFMIKS